MPLAATAAFLLAAAVACGAFGAHALKTHLDAYLMGVWEKAVFYHFVHGLAILAVALCARAGLLTPVNATRIGLLFLVGIALFSGSLYALALTRVATLGAVTPLGGLSFIAAWLWLGVALLRAPR